MPAPLFIEAITNDNRFAATQRVERAIAECEGWIMDHHAFSNKALSLTIEFPVSKAEHLVAALTKAGLQLADASVTAAWELAAQSDTGATPAERGCVGYINITFVHDEPDMRRTVPAIPG